jgi:ABC-type branched-subunit amino acid transport system ATPase component
MTAVLVPGGNLVDVLFMYTELWLSGYRCFSNLHVSGLRRVSLIVGKNNAGKTCLLEAIELLTTGSPITLHNSASRRGEISFFETAQGFQQQVDVRHAFFGRTLAPGTSLFIGAPGTKLRVEVTTGLALPMTLAQQLGEAPRALQWACEPGQKFPVPLTKEAGLQIAGQNFPSVQTQAVRFIGTGSLNGFAAAQVWGQVAARPTEDLVADALRIVEPNVDRIAAGVSPAPALFIRLKGEEDRVPLGSLGDGASHLLVLACQLVSAAGGVLLVDEIDSGLHVSAMKRMWRLVLGTALQMGVQVFATTHSDDCLRGLAAVLGEADETLREEVALHRIEKNAAETVPYSASEIVKSAIADIEVR